MKVLVLCDGNRFETITNRASIRTCRRTLIIIPGGVIWFICNGQIMSMSWLWPTRIGDDWPLPWPVIHSPHRGLSKSSSINIYRHPWDAYVPTFMKRIDVLFMYVSTGRVSYLQCVKSWLTWTSNVGSEFEAETTTTATIPIATTSPNHRHIIITFIFLVPR